MEHVWTEADLKYLRERYRKDKAEIIAEYLKVSTPAVYGKAQSLGLKTGRRRGRPLGKVNPNPFERRTDWKKHLEDIIDEAIRRDEAGEEVEIQSKGSRFSDSEMMAVFSRERSKGLE